MEGNEYTLSGMDASRTATDAGTYTVNVTGTPKVTDANGNDVTGEFTVIPVPGTLLINPKPVTVAADSAEKTFSEEDPAELTATVTGLLGSDTVRYTVTRAKGEGSENIGEYAITAAGEEYQGNYQVTYTGNIFTIKPKEVTVEANAKSKVFSDEDPTLDVTVTGLVGSDTITYTVTREDGENIGEYKITAAGDAAQGNYVITYTGSTFTIDPKEVTVEANANSKIFSDTGFVPKYPIEQTLKDVLEDYRRKGGREVS